MVESSNTEIRFQDLEDLVRDFLEMSRKDLKASKILFVCQLYPQSVFYVEQSLEKAAKASLISCLMDEIWLREKLKTLSNKVNSTTREDTKQEDISHVVDFIKRSVGHDAIRLAQELCSCEERSINLAIQILSKLRESKILDDLVKQDKGPEEKSLRTYIDNLISMLNNQKEETLKACQLVKSWSSEAFLKLSHDDKMLLEFIDKYKMIDDIITSGMRHVPQLNQFLTEQPAIWKKISILQRSVKIIYLFLLLYPHVTRTRYPEVGFNPINEYTERLPLVKHLMEIINLIEKTLNVE